MAGFFYQLGKKLSPQVRKAKWVWQSLFGSEQEMIAAEIDVGKGLAREMLSQLPCTQETEIQTFVSHIGERLAQCLKEKRRPFNITVVDDPRPNAFALPGGFIFVTRSILDLCAMDSSQVAFIVAHEMAHITKGHTMERMVMNSTVTAVTNLAALRTAMVGWARKVGSDAVQSVYSREQELEADALAVALSHAAGFDPNAGATLLAILARQNGSDEDQGLARYFSSHPVSSVRIAEIRRFTQKLDS